MPPDSFEIRGLGVVGSTPEKEALHSFPSPAFLCLTFVPPWPPPYKWFTAFTSKGQIGSSATSSLDFSVHFFCGPFLRLRETPLHHLGRAEPASGWEHKASSAAGVDAHTICAKPPAEVACWRLSRPQWWRWSLRVPKVTCCVSFSPSHPNAYKILDASLGFIVYDPRRLWPTLQARAVFFSGPAREFSDSWMWQGSWVRWKHWNGQAKGQWKVLTESLGWTSWKGGSRDIFLGLPPTGWRKQQKCIASQFWRLEVQDQGLGRMGSFWGCEGKSVLGFSPSFWWFAGNLWRASACRSCVAYPCVPWLLIQHL